MTVRCKFVFQNLKFPLLVCSDEHPSNLISPKCRLPKFRQPNKIRSKSLNFAQKYRKIDLRSPEFRKTYAKILITAGVFGRCRRSVAAKLVEHRWLDGCPALGAASQQIAPALQEDRFVRARLPRIDSQMRLQKHFSISVI